MSSGFILSTPAAEDLDEILNYVLDQAGPERAEHVRCGLHAALVKLADMPGMGHQREDLTSGPLLFWSVWSYLVVYKVASKPLEVVRVLHGARDVGAILETGE